MLFKRRHNISWKKKISIAIVPQTSFRRSIRYFYLRVVRIKDSKYRIATGIAMGVFISFSPFIGFHLGLTIIACFFARASYIAGAIGTIVGNPITFPFIYTATYLVGAFFVGTQQELDIYQIFQAIKQEGTNPVELIKQILKASQDLLMPLLIGWVTVGTLVALGFFFAVFTAMKKIKVLKKTTKTKKTHNVKTIL